MTTATARKSRNRRAPPRSLAVLPTPERMAKAEGYTHASKDGPTLVRDAPLDRLHDDWLKAQRRGKPVEGIDPRRYGAADKLRLHWHHAGLAEHFASLDPNSVFAKCDGSAGMPASEFQAHHRRQYRHAVQHLGLRVSAHLEEIVCRDCELVAAGRRLGWRNDPQARAAAMALLLEGLDRLADFWGVR